jgi:hypothetical protein
LATWPFARNVGEAEAVEGAGFVDLNVLPPAQRFPAVAKTTKRARNVFVAVFINLSA